MAIEGLLDFQEKIINVCLEYEKYLKEDLEACNEEGEPDYADQRFRQIEELQQVTQKIASSVYSLTPFHI